jgi:hypothetical protein
MNLVGLPLGAIVQKMRMNNESADVMTLFEEANADGPPKRAAPAAFRAPEPEFEVPTAPAGPPVHTLPEFKKYLKMKSIGVPLGSIKHKMETDGVVASKIEDFCASLSGGGASGPQRGPPRGGPSDAARAAHARRAPRATKPMMKLHWNKLDDEKVQNSVWSRPTTPATGGVGVGISENELDVIGDLFSADVAKKPAAGATPAKKKEPAHVQIVDGRRANNVGISLAQVPPLRTAPLLQHPGVRAASLNPFPAPLPPYCACQIITAIARSLRSGLRTKHSRKPSLTWTSRISTSRSCRTCSCFCRRRRRSRTSRRTLGRVTRWASVRSSSSP